MAGPPSLNEQQVRLLARIVRYQESDAILQNTQFNYEREQGKYLRDSKASFESLLGLLDAGGEMVRKYENDETKSPIANDIFSYVVHASNFSLQFLKNYRLRMNYLQKIREHSNTLMSALNEIDPGNPTNVARLAKDAVLYRNGMLEYTRKYQSSMSRSFSRALKESGLKFSELVQRYQTKLKYEGPFDGLEDAKKIEVYEEIMEASGRGRVFANQLTKALGAAGLAVLLFTAGMMVWDIFSSDHVFKTVTRNAVVTAASVGGAMAGEVIGAALSTSLLGAQASALFILAAGIIGGIAGGFLLGEVAGLLIDLIFGSGGNAPLSTEGHRFFVAPMPDGPTLALQISHQAISSVVLA